MANTGLAKPLPFSLLASLAGLLLPLVVVNGYYSDFGVLKGASLCKNYPPVTFSLPNNSLPVPPRDQYSNGFYHVGSLGNGLYYVTEGVYQALVLVGPDGIIAFDAPPTIGLNGANPSASIPYVDVVLSVPGVTPSTKIIAIVYSHAHADHIGAAKTITDRFPSVKIIAQADVLKVLSEKPASTAPYNLPGSSTPQPLPTVTFKTKRMVSAGHGKNYMAYLYNAGNPHSPGDIIIYFPSQSVLMVVDIAVPGQTTFIFFALSSDLNSYFNALDSVINDFSFKTFVGGHMNRLGTKADVELTRAYARDIYANAKKALMDPRSAAVFGTSIAANPFSAVHINIDQAACLCGTLTLNPQTAPSGNDWVNLYADATINTVTHCWAMIQASRLEFGI